MENQITWVNGRIHGASDHGDKTVEENCYGSDD